jgi:2'-5' RNA ligase
MASPMIPVIPLSLSSETQRLFFALWPQMETSLKLYELAGKLLRSDGRRVTPENIHLTLTFLGSVTPSFGRCAEQVSSAIRGESFTMTLGEIGCWSRSGILWAGPTHVPKALLQLVQALTAGLITCGYAPEKRPYTGHLTLARKVRRCQEKQPIEPLTWDVRQFCLVQSQTYAEGVRYEILHTWELSPPAA